MATGPEGNEGNNDGGQGGMGGQTPSALNSGGEGGQNQGGSQSTPASVTVDQLPEDVRSDGSLKPHIKEDGTVDLAGLAKSHVHAQQMIGRDKVVIPKEGDDDETWSQFFRTLGRPDTPDAYELPDVSDDAPDVQFDERWMGNFKQKAHELGLSNSQLEGLTKWFAQESQYGIEESQSQLQGAREKAMAQLRREHGAATDDVIAGAREVLNTFGDEDFSQFVEDSGLGDNPQFISFLNGIKKQVSEDVFGQAQRRSAGQGLAPADAQSRMAELKKDPAYLDQTDPRHKSVMQQLENLYPQAYPTEAGVTAATRDQMRGAGGAG